MKTKFILHGGFNPGQTSENNTDFYKEILKDAPEGARVLLVPFAKDVDRITLATQKVASELNSNKWQKSIIVEVANEEDFIQQLKSTDVAYFHGGASLKLLEALKKYPNLEESLNGKIVAGESAGANVWSKYFYSPKSDTVSEGLGVLPIKMIPHYKKEYEEKLANVGLDLEQLSLKEYEYKVFYK